ncbi:hypothetical protein [Pararhodobacter oceanensis]|uniref:Uncharacterized protein n=1 Tax=Pararhodobacter oceanensis TaxID=2172121 RepID=A0A2T8HR91_9RHOB|nr:hypothetical protein [Pararhodobacter oceanensis]PVH27948.1 hypothetical protein DDE20_14375 [Pararhodobacter oceanensis]
MNWKWLLTTAEPRSRYVLLVAIGVVLMMSLSYPVWYPGGRGMAAFAAIAAVILSHISAKSIMRK